MRFNGLFCKILKPGSPHLICKKNEALISKVDNISNMEKNLTISNGRSLRRLPNPSRFFDFLTIELHIFFFLFYFNYFYFNQPRIWYHQWYYISTFYYFFLGLLIVKTLISKTCEISFMAPSDHVK